MTSLYCKSCKGSVRAINYWYLFDNAQFYNRIAIIGVCKKCNKAVILLSERRKSDDVIFNDLQVGDKAAKLIAKCSEQINYIYDDIKQENGVPFGWKYGKAIKFKKGYKILRSDFKGNVEVIGYILDNSSKIITKEEYEQINS